ncbi:uncharacterized protein At5g39865 [Manihot esculenta]|uniref:Glutaredoxin domain-containing protein n=1 Tax=Manihot esculenta TaxID=3983 RepID=A0A2C9VJR3_MANES|nr:uncharacterized protein At5g39865 [Manihot esculenta]OAY45708.1 hypothetical protein MANES_07G084800v8 [Manihot esculenta]
MKGMKGKLFKKLKSIKPFGYVKQDRILLVNAADGFIETFPKSPGIDSPAQFTPKEPDQEKVEEAMVINQEPDIIDVAELMRGLEDDEMEIDDDICDKENIGPPIEVEDKLKTPFRRQTPLSEIDISSFRRPELSSGTILVPDLLAAFGQVVKEQVTMSEAESQTRTENENLERRETRRDLEKFEGEPPLKTRRIQDEDDDPLLSFEEKCPPGGNDSVILYTTTLRGIRKTFENCNSIRIILESFRVIFYERDVSMDKEFKEELWRVLESKVKPPRLFIKGRYIGGAEEILRLHEQGKFRILFKGVPIDHSTRPCEGCAGFRFVVCFHCRGSHRIVEDDGLSRRCHDCNENGLIICPLCC